MEKPSTQLEAFLFYMEKMDVEMIDLILDDDKTYEDVSKSDFISMLDMAISYIKVNGGEQLVAYAGFCDSNNCPNACKSAYSFVSKKTMQRIDLVTEVKAGKILDIYTCYDINIFDKIPHFKEFEFVPLIDERDFDIF